MKINDDGLNADDGENADEENQADEGNSISNEISEITSKKISQSVQREVRSYLDWEQERAMEVYVQEDYRNHLVNELHTNTTLDEEGREYLKYILEEVEKDLRILNQQVYNPNSSDDYFSDHSSDDDNSSDDEI